MLLIVLATSIGLVSAGPQTPTTQAAATQVAPPSDLQLSTDAAARMCGIWRFNKDLSTGPSSPAGGAPLGPGDSGGATGSRGGGGRGTGGGYGGGRGGGSRGGGGGRGGGGLSQAEMLQARALLRETTEAPVQLAIVASLTAVSLTDDQGRVRKFTVNDKKEKADLGTAEVDTKTKWDAGALTQEMSASRLKVLTTYQVTVEGRQMVVTIQADGGGGPSTPVKRIYDKVEQGDRQ